MADDKELEVTDIPSAKLKAVAQRVALEIQLAADKVAAHHADPRVYPLPDAAGSVEQLLASRFRVAARGTAEAGGGQGHDGARRRGGTPEAAR